MREEKCAYSSKVENFIFADKDDSFIGITVHMEDVGNKDDISTNEDDYFVCNKAGIIIMTTF